MANLATELQTASTEDTLRTLAKSPWTARACKIRIENYGNN